MAQTLYDNDEDLEKRQKHHDDLEGDDALTDSERQEFDDLVSGLDEKYSGDATSTPKASTSGESKERGELAKSRAADSKPGDRFKFNGDDKKGNWLVRIDKRIQSKRAKLLALVAGPLGLLAVIFVLLWLLIGPQKLRQLVADVTLYHATSTARAFRRSVQRIDGEKIALDIADDAEHGRLRSAYSSLRANTWGKLDAYRPEKVYRNLLTSEKISYNTEVYKTGTFSRVRSTLVTFANEFGDTKEFNLIQERGSPFSNMRARIEFKANLDAQLKEALRDTKTLVRSRVIKKFYKNLGLKFRFWEKLAARYRGTTNAKADILNINESVARISGDEIPGGSIVSSFDDASKALDEETRENLSTDEGAEKIVKSRGQTAEALENAARKAEGSTLTKALSYASLVYGVALPLCIIYDGSIENSASVVDSRSDTDIRAYQSVSSAVDQMSYGNIAPEAVGALNRQYGDIAGSVAERRARGEPYADQLDSGPQAGANSTFSIFDALVGGTVADIFDTVAEPICPIVTRTDVGLAVTGAELVAALASFGGEAAAARTAGVAIESVFKEVVSKFAAKMGVSGATKVVENNVTRIVYQQSTKKLLAQITGKFVKKFLVQGIVIGGATLLARMIVLSRAGQSESGLAYDEDAANQVEKGGNLYNNEVQRQMFYGRPATSEETVASRLEDRRELNAADARLGFYDRYLAFSNPRSLASKMGLVANARLQAIKSSPLSGVASLFSGLPGAFAGPSKVLAETNLSLAANDFNIVQWRWTEDEEALIDSDYTYYPLENERLLESSGKKQEIEDKYKKCYENTMGQLLADGDIQRNEDGTTIEDKGDCSPQSLGPQNSSYGDKMVFRWRLSKRYENTLDHLADIQNPTADDTSTIPSGSGNNKFFMIGDSLTVGMQNLAGSYPSKNYLSEQLQSSGGWSPDINAQGCRAVYQPNGDIVGDGAACPAETIVDGLNTINQTANISKYQSAGPGATFVIALGTNKRESSVAEFKQKAGEMIDNLKQYNPANIYWLNLRLESNTARIDERNAAIGELVAEKGISLLDWNAYVNTVNSDSNTDNNVTWPSTDSVHNDIEGYKKKVSWLLAGVGKAPTSLEVSPQGFSWPLPKENSAGQEAYVSSCWNDDRTGDSAGYYHSGLDIHADLNTPVLAAADGVVEETNGSSTPAGQAYYGSGFGKVLIIKHDNGKWTQYQHLNDFKVTVGQRVTRGQVVALSGNTGKSTSPHLHFNINATSGIANRANESLNPLDFLPNDGRRMTHVASRTFAPAELQGKTIECIPGPEGWRVLASSIVTPAGAGPR